MAAVRIELCSITTSRASGSATATTTTATPGGRSATRPGDRIDAWCDGLRTPTASAGRSERLSPLAARSYPARRAVGRSRDCGVRTPLQRDRDRIVHSKSFRRLKHKTQVFVAPEGDHYRTRLTHTLEVTQIARTVARALRLNEDLAEAIGLGHDLGHPPFGHIGEEALDACLRERFGREFRHYEHSLRVVEVLERAQPQRGRARRDPLPLGPRAAAADARGRGSCGSSTASPTSTTTSTTRSAPACSTRRRCRPGAIAVLGPTGSRADRHAGPRPGRGVGGGRRHRPGRGGRRGDGRAAHVHVRRGLPRAGGAGRARQDQHGDRRRCSSTTSSDPDAAPRRRRGARRRPRPAGDRLPRRA